MNKEYGILLPVSSLNSDYGIGDLGKSAYAFVDYMAKNGYTLWQMLPINDIDATNSPYSSDASLSLEELYVDIEPLIKKGLITKEDAKPLTVKSEKVDYDLVKRVKPQLIRKAYNNLDEKEKEIVANYAQNNEYVYNFGLFKALIDRYNTYDWHQWPDNVKYRDKETLIRLKEEEKDNIMRYVYGQMLFENQYNKLKKYANSKGIRLLGDIGIYLDRNSMDVWANPELFKLNENLDPYVVGGCPGQNWGTCIYNWEFKHFECYGWWFKRIIENLKKFDLLRLDHYAGFGLHYEIPVGWGEPYWYPACNEDFFQMLFSMINKDSIIIEDIGTVSQELQDLKVKYGLKGMVLMQWAFNGDETNFALPENVAPKNIYYIGTHDNNTLLGFINTISPEERKNIIKHYKVENITPEALALIMLKDALNANAETVVLTMQDLMLQDENYQMNHPGLASGQWAYRLPDDYAKRCKKLKDLLD